MAKPKKGIKGNPPTSKEEIYAFMAIGFKFYPTSNTSVTKWPKTWPERIQRFIKNYVQSENLDYIHCEKK